ncbi:M23 family metallopeptidase [Urechidicola croceus]|uniref:Peptidase M23 n=1 Tax=Urechidicola croceus TaxID=1850246 RepID=A0A1D8P4H9_9FLAO|nr:M23 family metallopeptidase [Urechidicola croceus]AOW19489.1 peptidase M23 [Urechidicola croceus]
MNNLNNFILSIFLLILTSAFSQQNYPKDYFQNPLDIPMYLSGTFAELRSNHFHSGLDIKTQQKEGFKVFSIADGYVSRIKVSHWGYGKALYVTHPNGYTSVYAHLKKYSDKIEAYIKKHQYEKESFEIQLFPNNTELQLKKGEVIAYTGSTGGYVGPHLHFEIRDSAARPVNPMHFGITVEDDKSPSINVLMAYPLDDFSHVNQSNIPLQINFKQLPNGNLKANKISASGTIGLGINAFDRLNGALNKNGIYSLEMSVNGEKTFSLYADRFSFSETKYINLLIDYQRYANINQRIQRCYVDSNNPLSIYRDVVNHGYISVQDGMTYNVEITAKDFKGNEKKLIVPIQGKNDSITIKKTEKITPYYISSKEFNKFTKEGVTIAFPKNTFYRDFYLDFDVKEGIAQIHEPNEALDNNYTLTFDVSKYSDEEKKKLFIAGFNSKGNPSYKTTHKKTSTFYTNTKSLGTYTLLSDNEKPSIRTSNFKDEQWVTNYKRLILKVSDNLSGLKTYRGEIDGEWILLEYNPKYGTLTYDFSDKKLSGTKHNLRVIVEDSVGNTNILETTFYRKQ